MKKKFNGMILTLAAMFIMVAGNAQEVTRRFSKSWPAGDVETLEITNKFGQVKVGSAEGSMVTVDVLVKADGPESSAKSLLDDVTITFGKSGKVASAETEIAGKFRSHGNFSIDYTVNIPAEKNLKISNKFGNVILDQLSGNGEFDVAYGSFTANHLSGPGLKLRVAYGKADVESMNDAVMDIAYSKLYLGKGGRMNLIAKYSSVNVDNLGELQLDSKYDTFNFGEIDALEGESKFSNYKIGVLRKRLKLSSGYGSVKVEEVPAGFELLDVNSSYAQVSLGIDDNASYQVTATCDYCDISYPREKFTGNKMKENTSQNIEGKVGSGVPGKVTVVSRYGNIKLTGN